MELGLGGKRALVAAGSSGLGLGIARGLANEGARVAICGRDLDRLDAAERLINSECATIQANLEHPEEATRFVTEANDALGGIDILICNAGGPPAGNFAQTPFAAYQRALELNLLSTIALCDAAVPEMRAQKWGRIIAITSSTVREPASNLILSNVARAGVTAFAKTLAREVARDGITVNTLQPGMHDTPRITALGVSPEAIAHQIPVGRIGDPDDFGRIAAFLCSQSANFITGTSLPVDGGAFSGLQ